MWALSEDQANDTDSLLVQLAFKIKKKQQKKNPISLTKWTRGKSMDLPNCQRSEMDGN